MDTDVTLTGLQQQQQPQIEGAEAIEQELDEVATERDELRGIVIASALQQNGNREQDRADQLSVESIGAIERAGGRGGVSNGRDFESENPRHGNDRGESSPFSSGHIERESLSLDPGNLAAHALDEPGLGLQAMMLAHNQEYDHRHGIGYDR